MLNAVFGNARVIPGLVGIILFSGVLLCCRGEAAASGVAVIEQSVQGLGTAFSGGAAAADNAATLFFNPAGMALLSRDEARLATHAIIPQAEFEDGGSTTALGTALSGGDGGNGAGTVLVPNLYYVHGFSENLKGGVAVNAPFGLTSKYDSDWVGRYHAIESELTTVNVNPSVSFRMNRHLSLGAGINIMRADLTLTNAIDYGLIGASAGLPTAPQGLDGHADLEADDWGYGYNLGILLEPSERTRFGLTYRSRVDIAFEGEMDFTTPAAVAGLAAALNLTDTDVKGDITLPETASFSAWHKINDRWAIMADVTWTRWSQFEEIRIEFDSGAADSVTTLDWENTWRYSAGATFAPADNWILRAGVAYDETPIPGPEARTPRIPGEDRIWVTFGGGYSFANGVCIDIGYAHLFIDDPKIEKSATGEDLTRGALVGEYDASVDIVSIEVAYRF